MPWPMASGVLGMARMMRLPSGSQAPRREVGMPARIETSTLPPLKAPASPGTTRAAICGLIASTTSSPAATARALSAVTRQPRAWSSSRLAASGSETVMVGRGLRALSPSIMALAMLPPPMKAIAGRVVVIGRCFQPSVERRRTSGRWRCRSGA